MLDEMHAIASQLVVKWATFGPSQRIDVINDLMRLTLDSIAFYMSGCGISNPSAVLMIF